jgi:hypothetical protein
MPIARLLPLFSGETTPPEGGAGHSIKVAEVVAEEAQAHPGVAVEAFATDEHRIGLKPVVRCVWAPVGVRPVAHGHHRFEWLYVTAFVSPAIGECFWYLSNGVSKPFFEALLAQFAKKHRGPVATASLSLFSTCRLAWREQSQSS